MIVELHGHSMAEARRVFTRLIEKMPPAARSYKLPPHVHAIVKQRLRAKIAGTRVLRRKIEDLLDGLDRKFAARAKLMLGKVSVHAKPKESLRESEGEEDEVTDSIIGDDLSDDTLYDEIHPTTEELLGAGMQSAKVELKLGFDVKPGHALSALQKYNLSFSTDFANRAKARVKALVTQGLSDGWTGKDLSQALLDEGIAQSVPILDEAGNVIRTMSAESWAELVARTESSRALNRGAAETYKQAATDGLISMIRWISTEDDRVCEDCEAMDGEVIAADDEWPNGGPGEIHTSCRCSSVADWSQYDTV